VRGRRRAPPAGVTLWSLRLAWRMGRWELACLIGGSLLLAMTTLGVAWQIPLTEAALLDCLAMTPAAEQATACRSIVDWGNILTAATPILTGMTTVAPFAVGMFVGAPLVAREIEHRTAPIAWSLSLSRRRWLAGRAVPLLVLVAVALAALGQAAEVLLQETNENALGFQQYGTFGPLIPARGIAVFVIGLAAGIALGRVLPSILVTGLATAVLMLGLSVGRDQLMRAEAVWRPADEQANALHMIYDSGFRSDTTGEIITWEQAYNRYPDSFDERAEGGPPGMTSVWKVVPPERHALHAAREVAALAAGTLAIGTLAIGLIGRRRPE
jgi:hypothetical protein